MSPADLIAEAEALEAVARRLRAAAERGPGLRAVWLLGYNDKIAAIKAVRHLSGLGLRESRELVERAPVAVLRGTADDCCSWAASLRMVGCMVDIRPVGGGAR